MEGGLLARLFRYLPSVLLFDLIVCLRGDKYVGIFLFFVFASAKQANGNEDEEINSNDNVVERNHKCFPECSRLFLSWRRV